MSAYPNSFLEGIMAHTLSLTTSHARLRGYCLQVEASLSAVPELASKAADWRVAKQEVIEHRALTESGSDVLVMAQAVNRVRDAGWDISYTEGSGLAYLLAGKKAQNEPYATVFRVPARRATSLGYLKATEVGERALAEAKRFGDPQLDAWAERFSKANAALSESGRAMEAAEDALDDPRFGKRALLRKLNALIAATEAFILTQFPGRSALAEAILIPAWERKGGKAADDAEPVVRDDRDGDAGNGDAPA